ncbi:hypothetical protein Nham_3720 [Nitrobacter hamburgensis X14]|jgi:hypothetical protein|uniref:Iron uptake protein n=1 Tax=Nitrobacter hamburgensis (strain DSM 10229 / NCIMB 13809 / X14) TaxID=323097 RepID=Q1QH52_NITHX|nr:hypothetical protein [Nitrobacter hamburgensis]ABE64445.1 hypothetical protein Nham_3720 [Nitrobacter hamburgensis X14]
MAERTSIIDPATGARRWWLVALRLLVLIVGGYAAASALVAGTAHVLPATGLARSEAVALVSMCGFGFYLALLIWGFSQPHLTRLVLGFTLAGGFGLALMMAMRV